ncbi:MAG: hypothetical protein GYA15_01875 [Leptolinea sp.]|nr:hypothetical protein [Leptolinea sp.]
MKKSYPLYVLIGYALLFLLAVVLRFNNLGNPLLSEKEAGIALQAAGSTVSTAGMLSGTEGWTAILSSVFFALGKSEFTARLLSAVFGTLLIFVPFLFSKNLGKETALILSVLVMFEPGMIAYSRQVNGAIITICGLLFFAGFFLNRRFVLAGLAAGLAAVGSPILWPAAIAFCLTFWLAKKKQNGDTDISDQMTACLSLERKEWVTFICSLGLTVVIMGSAFFTHPIGAAAPILNLAAYLRGWLTVSNLSPFLMLLSFLLYQPFITLFGLFEGIRYSRLDDTSTGLLLWWFVFSTLLVVIYPSRSMDLLLISYIPLLVLAARCIWRIIRSLEKPDIPAYGQMILVILLIPFCWLNVIVLKFPIEGQDSWLRAAAAGGALGLLIIASFLIRMGWPPRQASTGLWMGLAILSAIFMFSTAWRSAGLGMHPETELWNYAGITSEMDLLSRTAADLSEWNVSSRDGINIVILDYPSTAMKWGLRNFNSVKEYQSLPGLSNPAVVITAGKQVPALAEAYRGQDFALVRKTNWSLIMPDDWIKWFAFRQLPTETEQVILWARTDLFAGAARTAPATINPIQ